MFITRIFSECKKIITDGNNRLLFINFNSEIKIVPILNTGCLR